MIPSAGIQAFLGLYIFYIVVSVISLILKPERDKLKEFIVAASAFPTMFCVFLVISEILVLLKSSGGFGAFISSVAVDGMHIFIFLPALIITALLMWPIITVVEKIIPNKERSNA